MIRPAEVYGADALDALRALAALRAVGIEPRHLRGVRAAAEREAALIDQAIAPERRPDPAGRARSAERARELADHLSIVHASILQRALDGPSR